MVYLPGIGLEKSVYLNKNSLRGDTLRYVPIMVFAHCTTFISFIVYNYRYISLLYYILYMY